MSNKEAFETFNPADNSFTSRAAVGEITIRHLLTHTSGLGYSWSNEILHGLVGSERPSPSTTTFPLLHDPGSRWTYGESTRVLGRLVELVSGQPLEVFLQTRILGPLGMTDTGYSVPDEKRHRVTTSHSKTDGNLSELPNPEGAIGTTVRGDGGLFSTASDYASFIRMILNGGVGPDGVRLLSEESVNLMAQNQIGDVRVEQQPIADRTRARPFPLGAGRDSFGLGFQVTGAHDNDDMRSPGSLSWAGIFNTQFWIDRNKGIGGIMLMQYLPFYDEAAIDTLNGFEQRVYRHLD